MNRSLVIGSRGSKLALWQAEQVKTWLHHLDSTVSVEISVIKTTGDVKRDPLSVIGGKGVFTRELEEALLDRRIDLAVHSLKDLPTILPDKLVISAYCEREDPRDVVVLRKSVKITSLAELPSRAVIGTSSQRRLSQLKIRHPDAIVEDVRGNVDTRIRKLDEGKYDALILASAGLVRLGLKNRISLQIPVEEMVPAVGQGAIAVETRADNTLAIETLRKLDHRETRVACLAERAFLRSLGGGCQFPIAAHGIVSDQELRLDGLVALPDGSRYLRECVAGGAEDPEALGVTLAGKLNEQGAQLLLGS